MEVETPDTLRLIGALAVRFHLLSEKQVQQAVAALAGGERKVRPGQTLIDLGLLSEAQLVFLIDAQQMKALRTRDVKFGTITVEKGYATAPQIESSLQRQKEHYIKYKQQLLIGDILVTDGIISEAQKLSVIATQQQMLNARETPAAAVPHSPESELVAAEGGVDIIVSRDGMLATLRATPLMDSNELRARIDAVLEEYAIVFGKASEEAITGWIDAGEAREERFVLARGTPPVPGHGGEIQYHFDTDPLKAGKVAEGGTIDFKDRGEIPQVAEGALLVELSEPDPGVAGTDVRGKQIPPPVMKERHLLCGSGVALSADGRRALATVSGSPSLARAGTLSVFPLYKVDGDIGYKTGHVDFDGDIQVKGAVEKGFTVKGGRLSAQELEDAEITIKGDVIISGGILGGRIKVGGNLVAAYIHNAVIEVDGDVLVKKEVMDCDIKAGGGFYSESAIVLASRIAARTGIIAGDVGSEVSTPSTLLVGSDAMLELHITELNEVIRQQREQQDKLRHQIEQGEVENQQINIEISEVAQIQDRSQVEQRELATQRDALVSQDEQQQAAEIEREIAGKVSRAQQAEKKLNALFDRQDQIAANAPQLEQEVAALEEALHHTSQELSALEQQLIEEPGDVCIKISGTLYPMTTITTAHTSVKTKQPMQVLMIKEQVKRNAAGDEVWKVVTESLKQ
jgi:uncharacterized protein (DUF342 family)